DPEKEHLNLCCGYAFSKTKDTRMSLNYSDGWIGQVVKDKKSVVLTGDMIKNLSIQSGLIQNQPIESIVVPFYYNAQLKGILEIGFTEKLSASAKGFIETAADIIGVAIDTAEARETMQILYNQTQQQAEELESQQEELRVSNEELLSKTELLQASEEE